MAVPFGKVWVCPEGMMVNGFFGETAVLFVHPILRTLGPATWVRLLGFAGERSSDNKIWVGWVMRIPPEWLEPMWAARSRCKGRGGYFAPASLCGTVP